MNFLSCFVSFVNANCILIFHQFVLENPSSVPFHNHELRQDLQTMDANNSSVDNKDSIVRSVQLASECNAEKSTQNDGRHLHSSRYKTDELMLKSGSEVKEGDTPLCIASRQADDNAVKRLLEHGAEVNEINSLGESPLSIACLYGSFSTVKLLLENGADVNLRNENGVNPIYIAIENNHRNIEELLLHYGIDID